MTTNTAVQAQAYDINQRLALDLANIRNSTRYVDDVKRAKIARAYLRATEAMTALQRDHVAITKARRDHLQRHLFGIGSALDSTAASVSLRDATKRVDDIKPGDTKAVRALLDRALMQGDAYLAKACFARAWSDGDNDNVNAYLDAHPHQTRLAEELLNRANEDADDLNSVLAGAAFYVSRPSEIPFTPDSQLRELADSEDAHA